MVAVVDADTEFAIEKRAAASAGMRSGFVQHDPPPGAGEHDGRGEPGKPAANDMHPAAAPRR